MSVIIVDELKRQITVKRFFRDKHISFGDVEFVWVRRSWLLDSLPTPIGAVVPVYEVLLGMRGGLRVHASSGTSLAELQSRAAGLARRLMVPLRDEL